MQLVSGGPKVWREGGVLFVDDSGGGGGACFHAWLVSRSRFKVPQVLNVVGGALA